VVRQGISRNIEDKEDHTRRTQLDLTSRQVRRKGIGIDQCRIKLLLLRAEMSPAGRWGGLLPVKQWSR
jgi:hypothetical protein